MSARNYLWKKFLNPSDSTAHSVGYSTDTPPYTSVNMLHVCSWQDGVGREWGMGKGKLLT